VTQLCARPARCDERAFARRREGAMEGMEDDLASVLARRGRRKRDLIVFALIVVPHAFAASGRAQSDDISSLVTRSTKSLDGRIAFEAFLPFRDENLPFGGIIGAHELHNRR